MAAAKADKGKRVIGYIRVSTGEQELANQRYSILEWANGRGLQVTFIEETVSGMTSYKKRQLGKVIEEIQGGDIIIVSELSRLGRSMVEVISLLSDLAKKGVRVYAVKGGYSFDGSIQSKILSTLLAIVGEVERDLISQRTKEALARKKKEGVKLGRPKGPGKSKLDDKRDEIRILHEKKVSVASMAKIFDCSWPTMKEFIVKKVERGACP